MFQNFQTSFGAATPVMKEGGATPQTGRLCRHSCFAIAPAVASVGSPLFGFTKPQGEHHATT